jgi:hypothetical protein
MGVRRPRNPADAPDVLRQTVFGDAPLDVWTARGAGQPGQPWDSFEQAREMAQVGYRDEAVRIWRQIASADGLESRHTLQAWHFLRQAGQPPPPDQARLVLGVAAEMPVRKGHDLLAAYRDGTARLHKLLRQGRDLGRPF